MAYKIGLISLGCAKNLVNSEQMLFLLREAGYEITGETENVDAVIVNTCGFIESAKMEAIETILELGQTKKEGSLKKIIVAGCLSERYKDEMLTELPEVDAIVGTGSYNEIVSAVKEALEGGRVTWFTDINIPDPEIPRVVTTSEDWAYIKIAEGCDNRCAYCVIPDLRGKFRSRPMENIIAEAETLARRGIKELIVVAQDITRYGTDLYGRRTLSELLKKLCVIDGIAWIRLHYLYPDEIDDQLIDVIAEHDKILKYLDIPIQHISDSILKKMCRRGTGAEIRALFKKLRSRLPGLVLRTSLITGLPGEGEEEFEELCAFLREARIERAGVFPYSPEEGTPAAAMERPDSETAARRAELIMDIQAQIMDQFNESRIGSRVKVLVEGYDGGYHRGRSYAESPEIDGVIWFTGGAPEASGFHDVVITGTMDGDLTGEKA
jgi:ribosomal protein S12 methylthiotransferase